MPVPVMGVIAGLQAASSLYGMLSASRARKKAEEARRALLVQMAGELANEREGIRQGNSAMLMRATGMAGDALGALGRNLGDRMAGAGVYNSSATAGAVAQAQRDQSTALADLALKASLGEREQLGSDLRYLSGLQYGAASDAVSQANADQAGARQSLAALIGALPQMFPQKAPVPTQTKVPVPTQTTQTKVPGPARSASTWQVLDPAVGTLGSGLTRMPGPGERNPLEVPGMMSSGGGWLQRLLGMNTQQNLGILSVPNSRWMGPVMNGNQNGTVRRATQPLGSMLGIW